ncbi:axoneme-associated protein mst101(2) isoform X3 [Plodia interpunctella]|uniref:axoneme-associated protein mst101(2) isoform X3 n=1 Tax=Plodia interpunctella TaxID=58824 RepID=UPI002367F654|nr:axoneme-associated protein mst101(2)-like isoform X3 [Plodia interpunctella]
MASTDTSTSSSLISAVQEDSKRTVDEAFLNRLKSLVERLRLDNATLKKALDIERSEVRALKAQHEGTLRNLKTEYKKKEEYLEKQLRTAPKADKNDDSQVSNRLVELKKLTTEIQALKSANKGLQEKLKVAQSAECARAAELRAQAARHAALENAARRDARAQCHKLLEEIKSKERVIIQLRREAARVATQQNDQAQRMECGTADLSRKLRIDQGKEKTNREDLKTDIQHRKETFYREAPSDEDSAVSSAPASLSPQPLNDMWSCGQCRASAERASAAERECARLADSLRDARDQLELMEFRLLELEDATPEKGPRDNLTDSDSGCVSPGSRIKDSASPELKRMDSGYKSPHTPSSPCNTRRHLGTPHDDFKEDFAKAQVLADILDRNSESSDSLKSNPVKDHLEQMILNAASVEDRTCLEQVLMLLYNYQALSSSVSEDECYQAKPKRICDLKLKSETDIPSHKTQKAVATVTPYQQKGYKCESLESLCSEERKPSNILQESGIFEEAETESRSTQTDVNDSFECTGELNTEIQRLNSIREKLERQGVRNRTLSTKEEGDGLECRCVKLGKKHKQYYERRLKFLEGKISIYEAAQDVKESKLAERLQKEFLLENRIQDLESQLSLLQDKYERLEEECCELEEIENDTRLHWQQLEMDYELCSAQLRDMTEQRECSRAQAERLLAELTKRECSLKSRESELKNRLSKLEKAVPALIAWNVCQAIGANLSFGGQRALINRMAPYSQETKAFISQVREESSRKTTCSALVAWNDINSEPPETSRQMQAQITKLLKEKKKVEMDASKLTKTLEKRVKELEEELETVKRQLVATSCGAEAKTIKLEEKIVELEKKIHAGKEEEQQPVDPAIGSKIHALLMNEQELKSRVAELERRETAYLEMLTQADDMWAEMEGGYKKKIQESQAVETQLKGQCKKLECERDKWKQCLEPMRKKLKELEESESGLRISLEKAQRDTKALKEQNSNLAAMFSKADADAKKAEATFHTVDSKFKKEVEQLRKINKKLDDDFKCHKETSKKNELEFLGDLEAIRKELARCSKNNQELEVTNSELKEEEWQRAVSSMSYNGTNRSDFGLSGNAGVLHGASRLASVSCACAAARLCAALPDLADSVKLCQEEVLDHGDVKIMEEQLANAIESIVNCPSCALGTNAIVWSTDV